MKKKWVVAMVIQMVSTVVVEGLTGDGGGGGCAQGREGKRFVTV